MLAAVPFSFSPSEKSAGLGSSSAMVAVSVSLPRRYWSAQLARVLLRWWLFPFPSQEDVVRTVSGVRVGVGVHVRAAARHVFITFLKVNGNRRRRMMFAHTYGYCLCVIFLYLGNKRII